MKRAMRLRVFTTLTQRLGPFMAVASADTTLEEGPFKHVLAQLPSLELQCYAGCGGFAMRWAAEKFGQEYNPGLVF